MGEFSHFDQHGNAVMVDVTKKKGTTRTAIAQGKINFTLCKHQKMAHRDQFKCLVKTTGKTGVEMEALTGVQIALLTIYDMCKAIDKHMVMSEIHLVEKTGGKSGDFVWKES
mgnify:CR=1 FL=1